MKKRLFLLLWTALNCFKYAEAQEEHHPRIWINDITAFEQADRTQPPPKKAVLFVGSSSIRFWEDLPQRFPDKKVINRGFGGSWLSDVNHYFDRIVKVYQPKTIVLYAGENDMASGKSAENLLSDLETFLKLRRQHLPGSKVVFISLKPSPSRYDKIEEIRKANALICRRLQAEKRATFVDVFSPMLDKQGKPREALFKEDQLHMNQEGYDLWTQLLKPVL